MSLKFICSSLSLFFFTVMLSSAQANIKFNETTFDFGEIEMGTVAQHEFIFTNTGSLPLVISAVKASCGCTTPFWTKEPVLPGEQGIIKASYNSQNRPGNFHKSITVTSNAKSPTKVVYIKGNAVKSQDLKPIFTQEQLDRAPVIRGVSETLDLGQVSAGKDHPFTITVVNEGKSTLEIGGIYAACKCLRLQDGHPVTVGPDQQGELALIFNSKQLGGFQQGLQIFNNSLLQPRYKVTLKAEVVTPEQNTSIVKEAPSKITF